MKYSVPNKLMKEIINTLIPYQHETVDENEGGVDEINNEEVTILVNKLERLMKRQNSLRKIL